MSKQIINPLGGRLMTLRQAIKDAWDRATRDQYHHYGVFPNGAGYKVIPYLATGEVQSADEARPLFSVYRPTFALVEDYLAQVQEQIKEGYLGLSNRE